MDLIGLARLLLRRWPVVVLCLCTTGFAAVYFGGQVEPTYQANSSVLILAPSTTIQDGRSVDVNPFQRIGASGEAVMASALTSLANSESFAKQLQSEGLDGDYEVGVNPGGGGAILDVTVLSPTPESAMTSLALVEDLLSSTLQDQQEAVGAPNASLLRTRLLTRVSEPLALTTARMKTYAVICVLGLLVSLFAAIAVDKAVRSSRRRRARADADYLGLSDEQYEQLAAPTVVTARDGRSSTTSSPRV
jgi:uncharacterized protein involved in exopolysaccharide biosynthesis